MVPLRSFCPLAAQIARFFFVLQKNSDHHWEDSKDIEDHLFDVAAADWHLAVRPVRRYCRYTVTDTLIYVHVLVVLLSIL